MPNDTKQPVEIVEPIRRNIVVLAVRMFLVLFIADTLYAILIVVMVWGYVPSEWTASYTALLWVVHTLKSIGLTYVLILMVVNWISTLYYVSGGHLIRQRGVWEVKETVFQLSDIESVQMSQSVLGKLLNFGNVTIVFLIARQREELVLYAINNPQRYEQLFSKYV